MDNTGKVGGGERGEVRYREVQLLPQGHRNSQTGALPLRPGMANLWHTYCKWNRLPIMHMNSCCVRYE